MRPHNHGFFLAEGLWQGVFHELAELFADGVFALVELPVRAVYQVLEAAAQTCRIIAAVGQGQMVAQGAVLRAKLCRALVVELALLFQFVQILFKLLPKFLVLGLECVLSHAASFCC